MGGYLKILCLWQSFCYLLSSSWDGFCLGGMEVLPDLIVAGAVKRDEQDQLEQAWQDGRAASSVVSVAW